MTGTKTFVGQKLSLIILFVILKLSVTTKINRGQRYMPNVVQMVMDI
jgi:hypothetical protein